MMTEYFIPTVIDILASENRRYFSVPLPPIKKTTEGCYDNAHDCIFVFLQPLLTILCIIFARDGFKTLISSYFLCVAINMAVCRFTDLHITRFFLLFYKKFNRNNFLFRYFPYVVRHLIAVFPRPPCVVCIFFKTSRRIAQLKIFVGFDRSRAGAGVWDAVITWVSFLSYFLFLIRLSDDVCTIRVKCSANMVFVNACMCKKIVNFGLIFHGCDILYAVS